MTRRRRLWLLAGASLFVVAPAAHADQGVAPEKQGWWTTTGGPVPTLVPGGAGAGAPDVAKGQLYVSGSANGVVAAAAVRYLLPSDVTADTLSLTTAPGTVTVPGTKLRACPLVGNRDFTAAEGASIDQAPTWDCSRAVPGEVDPTGVAYRFTVGPLVQDAVLAIAIVPAGTADRVVLAGPDPTALSVRETTTPSRAATTASPVGGTTRPAVGVPHPTPNTPSAATPSRPAASPPVAATPSGETTTGATRAVAASRNGHGTNPPGAMLGTVGVIAVAIGVWWRGRQALAQLTTPP